MARFPSFKKKKKIPLDPTLVLNDKRGFDLFWIRFKRNWQLHLMMLLPMVWIIMFHYAPLYGIQIAFRSYNAKKGITGSDWVGLFWFQKFFSYYKWSNLVINTLAISLYSLIAGFPIPVVLAIVIHANEVKGLKWLTQNVSYIPHFISTVVMVGILWQVFNPVSGIWGHLQKLIGVVNYSDIRSNPDAFRHLYVWSGIWQTMGWSTIIYIAALSAVSMELHEAARIDGANRFDRVIHVDIPTILPTVSIMLILRVGSIMSVGYEKVYLMQNSLNIGVSEVISTYVYKNGLAKGGKYLSYGAAIGLMNSVINTTMVVLVNAITNKLTDGEGGLF